MRVLFLTHPEADYGEYFLYNGLCQLLGPESVWDVPYKKSYHGQVHTYAGYDSADHRSNDWGLCGRGPMGVTAPFEWAVARNVSEHSREEVLDACRSNAFDFVVVGSPRHEPTRFLRLLKPELKTDRIVLHDGEDHSSFATQFVQQHGIRLYLKREWYGQAAPNGVAVRPMPFSSALHISDSIDKTVDVLCAVGETNPARGVAKEVVRSLPNANVLCGHWGWTRYIELIYASRMAVAPRGFGQDTVRRWEVPAFDTLLVCQRLDIREENPLEHGKHCAYYSTAEELREQLEFYVRNVEEARKVALAGQDFVRQHHTNAARAGQAIAWAKEVYG